MSRNIVVLQRMLLVVGLLPLAGMMVASGAITHLGGTVGDEPNRDAEMRLLSGEEMAACVGGEDGYCNPTECTHVAVYTSNGCDMCTASYLSGLAAGPCPSQRVKYLRFSWCEDCDDGGGSTLSNNQVCDEEEDVTVTELWNCTGGANQSNRCCNGVSCHTGSLCTGTNCRQCTPDDVEEPYVTDIYTCDDLPPE